MIRDPSDGSVREKSSKEINLPANETSGLAHETASKGITSALAPNPIDAKESARLIKSREWIKNYHSVQSTAEVAETNLRSPTSGEG